MSISQLLRANEYNLFCENLTIDTALIVPAINVTSATVTNLDVTNDINVGNDIAAANDITAGGDIIAVGNISGNGINVTANIQAVTANVTSNLTSVTANVTSNLTTPALIADSLTASTTNGDLALAGNGTGFVSLGTELDCNGQPIIDPLFADDADPTKRLDWDLTGITTATTRTITVPDSNITLVSSETLSPTITFSGPWASSQMAVVNFYRVGSFVNAVFEPLVSAATIPSTITSTVGAVPASMRPSAALTSNVVLIIDDGTNTAARAYVDNAGTITIFANAGLGTFAGAGNAGWGSRICMSWNTL